MTLEQANADPMPTLDAERAQSSNPFTAAAAQKEHFAALTSWFERHPDQGQREVNRATPDAATARVVDPVKAGLHAKIDVVAGQRGADGRPILFANTDEGAALRTQVERMRQRVESGEIRQLTAEDEARIAEIERASLRSSAATLRSSAATLISGWIPTRST